MYTEAVSIYVSGEGRKEAVQLRSWIAAARTRARGRVRGGAHGQSLSRTGAPLDPHACNPRATAHHCSARDTVAGPTPKRDSAQNREGGWGSKTGRVGCGCHEDRRPRRRWTRLIRFTLTAVLLTGHVKSRPSASP